MEISKTVSRGFLASVLCFPGFSPVKRDFPSSPQLIIRRFYTKGTKDGARRQCSPTVTFKTLNDFEWLEGINRDCTFPFRLVSQFENSFRSFIGFFFGKTTLKAFFSKHVFCSAGQNSDVTIGAFELKF